MMSKFTRSLTRSIFGNFTSKVGLIWKAESTLVASYKK